MKDAGEREDLFQEILLHAWKGSKNFKGDAKFSTWLYRVALNTAITFYRKESRRVTTTTVFGEPEASHIQDDSESAARVNAMYQSIALLSKVDKAIVMLYLEDYSYQEIGEITGITANNVAVKMNRIKTKLRENSKKYLST
jgi:RNA polymerase sigma factor (sigma-70 family)